MSEITDRNYTTGEDLLDFFSINSDDNELDGEKTFYIIHNIRQSKSMGISKNDLLQIIRRLIIISIFKMKGGSDYRLSQGYIPFPAEEVLDTINTYLKKNCPENVYGAKKEIDRELLNLKNLDKEISTTILQIKEIFQNYYLFKGQLLNFCGE
jgi:hypothetical protein